MHTQAIQRIKQDLGSAHIPHTSPFNGRGPSSKYIFGAYLRPSSVVLVLARIFPRELAEAVSLIYYHVCQTFIAISDTSACIADSNAIRIFDWCCRANDKHITDISCKQVNIPGRVLAVSAGERHIMVSTTCGLYAGGENFMGQLGTASAQFVPMHKMMRVWDPVTAVSCNGFYTMIVSHGQLFVAGRIHAGSGISTNWISGTIGFTCVPIPCRRDNEYSGDAGVVTDDGGRGPVASYNSRPPRVVKFSQARVVAIAAGCTMGLAITSDKQIYNIYFPSNGPAAAVRHVDFFECTISAIKHGCLNTFAVRLESGAWVPLSLLNKWVGGIIAGMNGGLGPRRVEYSQLLNGSLDAETVRAADQSLAEITDTFPPVAEFGTITAFAERGGFHIVVTHSGVFVGDLYEWTRV